MTELERFLDIENCNESFTTDLLTKADSYEDIIIFGAGFGGADTYELLKNTDRHKNKVKAFSDNNKDKIGKMYCGLPVINPVEIASLYKKALVLVSSTAFDIIKKQLIEMGIFEYNIFFFQPYGLSLAGGGTDREYVKDNIDSLSWVYDRLMDKESKELFTSLLKYRICKKQEILDGIRKYVLPEKEQYFDKRILDGYFFSTGFVDAGAYTGDTLTEFLANYPDWSGTYYCFEADPEIADSLENAISKNEYHNVVVKRIALWNERTTLKFDTTSGGRGAGSKISSDGIDVGADSLDDVLLNVRLDFIKMDIEGAEHKALLGARNIIVSNKPILTICIYHKREDFFDIPCLIETLCPNEYDFYVRQYRYGQTETVLYAMPRSRRKTS